LGLLFSLSRKKEKIEISDRWKDRHNNALERNYVDGTYILRGREGNDNSDEDSNIDDDNKGKKKTSQASTSSTLKIYQKVTGQISLPIDQEIKLKTLERIINNFQVEEEAIKHLKEAFKARIETPRKDGNGNYSPLNLGWIEWAEVVLSGKKP
jgi:hypothetical protein